jgi:hypothetical protein
MTNTFIKYKEIKAAELQPSDIGHVVSVYGAQGGKLVGTLLGFGIHKEVTFYSLDGLADYQTGSTTDVVIIYREVKEQGEGEVNLVDVLASNVPSTKTAVKK